MALDLRTYNCLPEHEGPAFRTWSQIIQTTAASSNNLASPLLSPNSWSNLESSFPPLQPAEDFLPFNNEKNDLEKRNEDDETDGSHSQRKKNKTDRCLDDAVLSLTYAPWKQSDYPENAYGLHMEIKEFYDYMSPSPEEKLMRENVVTKIQDLILSIWPAARIEVFGSFKTNLYLPTSDIDLVVFGEWEKLPLWTLERALVNENIAESSTIKVLDKASVPIVKLTEKLSNLKVDISFNMDTAVKGAELIQKFLKTHKVLPYLFLVLKHFLVMRGLNEVFTGGISSYCLMLLTVSFLQMHPRQESKLPNANIGVLLIEFFELYGRNFNYQRTGIKIRDGGCYCSKEEIMREMSDGQFPSLLCIEDPVSKVTDIGKSSYGIMRVKEAFEYAYNVLDSALRNRHYFKINPSSTYLSRIIRVSPELIQYRRWIKSEYKADAVSSVDASGLKSTDAETDQVTHDKKKGESVDKEEIQFASNSDLSCSTQEKDFQISEKDISLKDTQPEPNKHRIADLIKKTSDLRSDIVKASISGQSPTTSFLEKELIQANNTNSEADSESNESQRGLSKKTFSNRKGSQDSNVSHNKDSHIKQSQSFTREINDHKADETSRFHGNEESYVKQTHSLTREVGDKRDETRVSHRNKPKNIEPSIGVGGDMQWSSDECSSEPLDIPSKHSHACHLKNNESGNERSRNDKHHWTKHDPCEGISQHDLANAQHARQLIISSPEKPCVKSEKWSKHETKVSEHRKSSTSEEKHKTHGDQRHKTHGKDLEHSGITHHSKDHQQHHHKSNESHKTHGKESENSNLSKEQQQHKSSDSNHHHNHHHHDDSSKHLFNTSRQKRRNKKDSKSS